MKGASKRWTGVPSVRRMRFAFHSGRPSTSFTGRTRDAQTLSCGASHVFASLRCGGVKTLMEAFLRGPRPTEIPDEIQQSAPS